MIKKGLLLLTLLVLLVGCEPKERKYVFLGDLESKEFMQSRTGYTVTVITLEDGNSLAICGSVNEAPGAEVYIEDSPYHSKHVKVGSTLYYTE